MLYSYKDHKDTLKTGANRIGFDDSDIVCFIDSGVHAWGCEDEMEVAAIFSCRGIPRYKDYIFEEDDERVLRFNLGDVISWEPVDDDSCLIRHHCGVYLHIYFSPEDFKKLMSIHNYDFFSFYIDESFVRHYTSDDIVPYWARR